MNLKKYLLKISSFISLPLVSLASVSCSNNQNIPPVDYEMINKETGLAFNSKGEITKYYYYEGNDFTNITIPEYLVNNSIPSSQYYGYKQRITSIGNNVFSTETKYENGLYIPIYNEYAKDLKSIILPNSITSLGIDAFYGTSLTQIHIPDSVVYIGSGAFKYCKNLISVKLSNNTKNIGSSSFAGTSIKHIFIPDSVFYIETNAFLNSNLEGFLNIPDSVGTIYSGAFAGTKINKVSISKNCGFSESAFPIGCIIERRPQ